MNADARARGYRTPASTVDGGAFDVETFARRWGWQAIAAACTVVIVVSALRGLASGYQPVGDNALIELRGRDVFTGDHPLLGTWSSASISAGLDVNHPGPLIFDLVAVPVRLFGGAAGIALAVAALHVATVWLVGVVTARAGGPTAAIATMTVTAALVWTLGSELLYDPWQPNVLVLPFWLLLCTLWAIVAGEAGLFPLACGVGSFAMQTHLGYIVIVPVLLGSAAAYLWWTTPFRDQLRRPALASVGVIVVLWAQPLWEQFTGAGRGNLSRVLTAATGGGDDFEPVEHTRTGVVLGVRTLGSVLALPPWWTRGGYDDAIPPSTQTVTDGGGLEIDAPGLRTFLPSLLGLVVLATLLVLAWRVARRAGERQVVAGFTVLAAAMAVAVVTVVITPIDILGLSPHKLRWLWVIGAFSTLMLVMGALAGLGGHRRRQALIGLGAVAAVACLASLPTHANRSGPVYFEVTYASIESLRDQVDDHLDGHDLGPVRFDADGIGFAEPYTAPVMAELLEHGVDLVVDDRSLARQLGPDRDGTGVTDTDTDSERTLVYVRAGSDALEVPAGTTRIAFHDGDLSPFSVTNVTDRAVGVFVVDGGSPVAEPERVDP